MRGTTEMRPFSVFLEWEMMCPKCRKDDKIRITIMTSALLGEGGTESDGDHEWSDTSDCSCGHCGWVGTVSDTKPKYYDLLVTAMVIWEEILDEGNDFDVMGGVCATRDHFAKMVPEVEQAFHYALTLGYDEPFDWDFVPWFLTLLDDDLKLPDDWAQPVWEHCQK